MSSTIRKIRERLAFASQSYGPWESDRYFRGYGDYARTILHYLDTLEKEEEAKQQEEAKSQKLKIAKYLGDICRFAQACYDQEFEDYIEDKYCDGFWESARQILEFVESKIGGLHGLEEKLAKEEQCDSTDQGPNGRGVEGS